MSWTGGIKSWNLKKTNLFSGIGLYRAALTNNPYGWRKNENEMYEQLTYCIQCKNIDGFSIYNFNCLRKLRDGVNSMSAIQVKNAKKAWKKKVPPTEIKSFE